MQGAVTIEMNKIFLDVEISTEIQEKFEITESS